jgi:hypothetical protein
MVETDATIQPLPPCLSSGQQRAASVFIVPVNSGDGFARASDLFTALQLFQKLAFGVA